MCPRSSGWGAPLPVSPLHGIRPAFAWCLCEDLKNIHHHSSQQAVCQRDKDLCSPPSPILLSLLHNKLLKARAAKEKGTHSVPWTVKPLRLGRKTKRKTDSTKQNRKPQRRGWDVTGKACSGLQVGFCSALPFCFLE